MAWTPLPFAGGSYADDSLPWSHQDTVNYIPVKAERGGTRSPMMLRSVPGMRAFAAVGNGPIRIGGCRDVEGKTFVVSGTQLWRVQANGVSSLLGSIPGSGPVSMTHNQIANGNQLVIATGSSGYVYDTHTSTLTQITDPAFSGFVQVDYLNQYIVGIEPLRKKWQHSELNDALSYNSLDSYEGESSPDRMVGIVNSHGQVLVMSERSGEFYDNIVDPNSVSVAAFQRSQGTAMERGCAAASTIAKLDNSILFCGNDGVVYRLDGYTPVRVSTHAIEQALAKCNLANAFAFVYEDRGHAIYYLTCPDGYTWGYDVSTQEWHRRQSYGLTRWRVNALFKSNGKWLAGDYSTNLLYQLDWDYMLDNCDVLERSRTFAIMHAEQNRVSIDALELVIDTGGDESLHHAAVTLTGHLAAGLVGDVISSQYVIRRAYPGESFTVALQSGALPTGLSISAAGLVTGTLTVSGTFSWVLQVADECGNITTLADSTVISDTAASAILVDAPILYWKLNETSGSTVIDYSGNARNGTITGTPTQSSSGLTLTALASGVYFPGNAAGSVLDVGTDSSWALEAVITRTGTGGVNWEQIIGQFRSPAFGYMDCLLALAASPSAAQPVGAFTRVTDNSLDAAQYTTAIANSTRTHLMVVRDAGSGGFGALRLYLNGTQVVANTTFASTDVAVASNGAKFVVGGDSDAANYYPASYGFLGKIEHVAVYSTTISAARVLYHAQRHGLA